MPRGAAFARPTLRSPLAVPEIESRSIQCDEDRYKNDHDHDVAILPWVCALLAASDALDLSVETQFTASVLLHRYQYRSGAFRAPINARSDGAVTSRDPFDDSCPAERFAVAACLFLAGKAENDPRRLREVVNCALQLRVEVPSHDRNDVESANQAKVNRLDRVRVTWDPFPSGAQVGGSTSNDESSLIQHNTAKRGVLDAEQTILRWLAFEVQVSHPHRLVVLILQYLTATWLEIDHVVDSSQSTMDRWRRRAWQRLNSAVFSISCLRHDVVSLACAAMDLELHSLSVSLANASAYRSASESSNFFYPGDLPLSLDWYLAVPGVSKESVAAARLDLERIASSLS